jgi:hypothetical protein
MRFGDGEEAQRRPRRAARILTRSALAGCASAVALATFFATPALAAVPTARTGVSGSVTYQSAVLFGTVNPRGASTVVYFQYGTTAKYGAQSAPDELPAGTADVAISLAASGLVAGTTYHYRIVATNASGTALGADHVFTAAKIPLSLAITAAPNPVPFGAPVTVEGTLSGTGSGGAVVQLQENPFPYTGGFVDVANPELTLANGTFVFNVLSMSQNTEFRVVSGSVVSTDVVVGVSVGVTMQAQAGGTRKHPSIRFSGLIAPAEPSARVAFERLIGKNWKVVGGTVAHATAINGVVSFATTVRVNAGGFFRALVLPVEGSHVSGYSATSLVRIR